MVQRDRRTFKPKQKAAIEIWAREVQEKIAEAVNSVILKGFDKKNMRSLNSEETHQSEMMKFEILLNFEPGEDVSQESIFSAINKDIDPTIHDECNSWISEASIQIGRRLAIEEIRNLRAAFYSELKT